MRPMTVALIASLSIAFHGTFSPAGADPVNSTNCPRLISTQKVMSSAHANQATTLVYRVVLVNAGQGALINGSGSEAVMILPPRATVDLSSLALQSGLTVTSEGGYDTSIRWDLALESGGAVISAVTVTVQDKPIEDGFTITTSDPEDLDLFLYVNGSCTGGTAP